MVVKATPCSLCKRETMSRNYLHPSRLSVFPLSIMVNIELVWSKEKLCRFDDASPRQPMRHESKNSYSRTVATASFAFFYFSPLNPFVSLPLRAFFFFFFSLFLSLYFFFLLKSHSWPRREKEYSLSTRELLEAFGIGERDWKEWEGETEGIRDWLWGAVSLLFF